MSQQLTVEDLDELREELKLGMFKSSQRKLFAHVDAQAKRIAEQELAMMAAAQRDGV